MITLIYISFVAKWLSRSAHNRKTVGSLAEKISDFSAKVTYQTMSDKVRVQSKLILFSHGNK